jgi:hypothetical protein
MAVQSHVTEQDVIKLGAREVIKGEKQPIKITLRDVNGLDLSSRLYLVDCDLRGSSFWHVRMCDVDFRGSDLSQVDFFQVNLQGADLSASPCGRVTTLKGAELVESSLQRVNLCRAILTDANLGGSDLQGANLQGANLTGANLANVRFGGTRVDRGSFGPKVLQEKCPVPQFLDARSVYLELKANFLSIGAYDDAAWAYIRERTMARKSWHPRNCARFYGDELDRLRKDIATRLSNRFRPGSVGSSLTAQIGRRIGTAAFYMNYTRKWLLDLLFGASWGYGQKPEYALLICVAIVFAFALGFCLLGGIQANPDRALRFWEYLVYSAGSFVSVTFNDLVPVTLLAKYLSVGEAFLGLATFALFVSALGQRIGGR